MNLEHALPYDPVKAHEYYLRTRHLKGKHSGQIELPKGNASKGVALKGQPPKQQPKLAVKPKPTKTAEQQRKEVEARVRQLKTKLTNLRAELRKLLNQSQGRTVVDAKGRLVANKHTTKKSSAGSTHLTTAEKRKAAKASKQYRQTHKQQISLQDQQNRLKLQIIDVENKISKARDHLKASVVNARKQVSNRQK